MVESIQADIFDHLPVAGGLRLHGRPGQMPKTRRRAGDRTAGAGWQLCCLIDRAEELKFLSCLLRSGAHNL